MPLTPNKIAPLFPQILDPDTMRPKSAHLRHRNNYRKTSQIIVCLSGPNIVLDLAVLGRSAKFLSAAAPEFADAETKVTERDRAIILSVFTFITVHIDANVMLSNTELYVGALERLSDFIRAVATSAAKRRQGI